jgi:type IV secretion system protein VirB4
MSVENVPSASSFYFIQTKRGSQTCADIPKVVRLNLDRRSYATFSTKPKDRVRRSRLIAKYGLTEGITRFAQGETE